MRRRIAILLGIVVLHRHGCSQSAPAAAPAVAGHRGGAKARHPAGTATPKSSRT